MLTDYNGYKILIMRNLETGKYKVRWAILGTIEHSADGFETSADAFNHARRNIDRDSALPANRDHNREEDGNIIYA